jgi:ribonuclease HI
MRDTEAASCKPLSFDIYFVSSMGAPAELLRDLRTALTRLDCHIQAPTSSPAKPFDPEECKKAFGRRDLYGWKAPRWIRNKLNPEKQERAAARARRTATVALPPDPAPSAQPGPGLTTPLCIAFAARHRLRFNPATCIYTDGSVVKATTSEGHERNLLGAAAYDAATDTAWHVDPKGGTTGCQTIMRCELSGIWHGLRMRHGTERDSMPLVLFTDSLTSLFAIRRMMLRPETLELCIHKDLLLRITQELRRRAEAGWHTQLVKVKAHSGVPGNERADKEATAAGAGFKGPLYNGPGPLHSEKADNDPRTGYWWLRKRATPAAEGQAAEPARYVADLGAGLKSALCRGVRAGYRPVGIYGSLIRTALPSMDVPRSTATLRRCGWGGAYRLARPSLLYLWGCMWNAKLAARFGCTLKGKKLPAGNNTQQVGQKRTRDACNSTHPPAAPDAPCAVCGGPDSGTHIMGGCRHADTQRLYINRHNRGLLCVAEAVSRGNHGAGYMVLDATSLEATPAFAPDSIPSIPAWRWAIAEQV